MSWLAWREVGKRECNRPSERHACGSAGPALCVRRGGASGGKRPWAVPAQEQQRYLDDKWQVEEKGQ